jgi:hypothetical protein
MFDTSWIDAATQVVRSRADQALLGLMFAEGLAMALWAGVSIAVWHLCHHARPTPRPYGC